MASQKLHSDLVHAYVASPMKDKPPLHPRQIEQEVKSGQRRCKRCTGVYPATYFQGGVCEDCYSEKVYARR